MRRICLCAAASLLVAGCHREPTFDERYEAARAKLDQTARDIDAQAQGSGVPTDKDEESAK